jgi:hypothetical protein
MNRSVLNDGADRHFKIIQNIFLLRSYRLTNHNHLKRFCSLRKGEESGGPNIQLVHNCNNSEYFSQQYVSLKNAVFWDVGPSRSCVNRRFRGTYRLHLQGRKIR